MGIAWSKEVATNNEPCNNDDSFHNDEERKIAREEDMRRFKEELAKKREARSEAIKALNAKIILLEKTRDDSQKENERLREELDRIRSVNDDANHQKDNDTGKNEEIEGLEKQVKALKEVAMIGGEMLKIRELQVNELKDKLMAIEETGQAYEKEVENMRRLKNLYEDRARAMAITHQMELDREKAKLVAAETRKDIAEHRTREFEEKNKEVEERLETVNKSLDEANGQISDLKIQLASKSEDLYHATSQMTIINQLFGQLLTPGPDSLGRITKVLEEHRDLVNHLTNEGKITDLASTLVNLADKDHLPNTEDEDVTVHLSKVWRLLVELLGHHMKQVPDESPPDSCYKSVETPSGPKLVISVSQTFLRLKDLILEKNTLVKEVGRLKQLNCSLENRLIEQESRLVVVASELHKTWGVVSKLKTQHKQLHTHEKVLRYELAQKRLLLNELKKQLEDCKDNWNLARAKNHQTENDWRELRSEFASRKQQISSAESGYEESPSDSLDEEDKDPVPILKWEERELTPTSKLPQSDVETEKWSKEPTPSLTPTGEPSASRSVEEVLEAREARLSRLEAQCQGLFSKMSQTSQRSDAISDKLVKLHEQYGGSPRQRSETDSESSIDDEPEPSVTNPDKT